MSSIVRKEVNGSSEPDGHLKVGVQIQDLVKVRYLVKIYDYILSMQTSKIQIYIL